MVLLCLTLGGLAEGLGLASLLPMISLALGGDGAEPSGPVAMIADLLAKLGIPADVFWLTAFAVGAIVLKNALRLLAMTYVGYCVARIVTGMRRDLVENLLKVRWSHFTQQPLGQITNTLSIDANRAGHAYLSAAEFLVFTIQASVYIIVALFVAWQTALVAVAVGATIALLLGHFIRRAKRAGRAQTRQTSAFIVYLSDTLNNIKPLKAMDRQRDFARLLDKKIGGIRRAMRRQVVAKEVVSSGSQSLAAIAIGIGFASALVYWDMPPAELAVLSILLIQLVNSINRMQREYQKAVIFESAYYSVLDQIEVTEAAREFDPGTEAPSFEQGCRFENVRFSHPRAPVLNGVTLAFPKNTTTVLTGPSGAGKTTIMDLLLGFYAPDSGQVLIDGRPLHQFSLRKWRSMIGYVPQEPVLFHDSIFVNVTLGDPGLSEADAREALRIAGAVEFVDSLPDGVHTEVGEKGSKFSGGQRQRIALARALVGKPQLLILDEVTSALDPETERAIVENIRALRGETTVIAVTHRPAFLEIADQVYVLNEGRVVPREEAVPLQRRT